MFVECCEKIIKSDKVRDHCHLTGNYTGPAHSKCKTKVTQDKSNIIPFIFHNFSKNDCHMVFKKLVDRKNDKVILGIIPKTNEEQISVTYVCIKFIDSFRFLSMSLDGLVKNSNEDDFKILNEEFPDKWKYFSKKLAYPYEYINSIDDYQNPVDNLKNEDFCSNLKKKCPEDDEIQRTKKLLNNLILKMEKI